MLTSVGFFPWRLLEAFFHEVLVTGLFLALRMAETISTQLHCEDLAQPVSMRWLEHYSELVYG